MQSLSTVLNKKYIANIEKLNKLIIVLLNFILTIISLLKKIEQLRTYTLLQHKCKIWRSLNLYPFKLRAGYAHLWFPYKNNPEFEMENYGGGGELTLVHHL